MVEFDLAAGPPGYVTTEPVELLTE
jgi:hypothetical protein